MAKRYVTLLLFTLAVINNVSSLKKKACVIGAGPAGLISARFLAAHTNDFEPIVFEKNSDVGGLWIYTDSTTVDKHGLPVHSSMYRDLRINGPKELLKYPDFDDISEERTSFVGHKVMLEYLRRYAVRFSLRRYIQFDTNVEKVTAFSNNRWHILARDLNTKKSHETLCDAVMVANGNFVKEYRPEIPGIENFPGLVIHSHLYRKPEVFAKETVVILGAAYSGIDIAIQISAHAKKVYLSSKHPPTQATLPKNIEKVANVIAVTGNEFILSDMSVIEADTFIFCTGYLFDFPFLDESSGIVIDSGKYVKPLYKHLINIEHPTMAILNLPFPGFPFLMPYAQVQYFLAVLRGNVTLPSREEMMNDSVLPSSKSTCMAHFLDFDEVLSYYNELSTKAGGKPLPLYFKPAIEAYWPNLVKDPVNFRNKNLKIYADNRVEFVRKVWHVKDYIVDNLYFVLARNAGHNVPMYQPFWPWDMITRFTRNMEF